MQIKMTMRYHLTPVRMAIINILTNKSAGKDVGEKRNPPALLVGMQTGAATVEDSMEFPHKVKNGTAIWPSNPTSRIISQEIRNTNQKGYMHPYVHRSTKHHS